MDNNIVNTAKQSAKVFFPDLFTTPDFVPINEIEDLIKETIIGQDEAISRILLSLYCTNYLSDVPCVTLIIGPSGCGKTETICQMCSLMDLPYTIESATQYTQEGYVGNSVDTMIVNLINNCYNTFGKESLKLAEEGIIFIDEIGKKASKSTSDRDVSGLGVLHSLLPILSGQKMNVSISSLSPPIQFNCSHLKIFLADAFVGLNEIREKRLNTKTIGFQEAKPITEKDFSPEKSPFTKKDLIEYGLPPEFVGRINKIVVMNDMTVEILEQIAKTSASSLYCIFERNLKSKFNIEIFTFDNFNIFREIAEATLNYGTGARELNNTINYVFEKIFETLFKLSETSHYYDKLILYKGITSDNSKFSLIPVNY